MGSTGERALIRKGQRVHCILYGGQDGAVFEIHGEQHPETVRQLGGGCVSMGGGASFDIVWDHGAISRGVPESIVLGVQWRIKDEIATDEEIAAGLAAAAEAERVRKDEADEEARQYAAQVAELPALFPYLETTAGGSSPLVLGARNIKAELSRAFSGVRFSVKSERFGGGDSIEIAWTDGPTPRQVMEIGNKYKEGDFDGMTDSYNYRDSPWPAVFGGADYVQTHRRESPAWIKKCAADLGFPAIETDEWGNITNLDPAAAGRVYTMARSTEAAAPAPAGGGNGNGREKVSAKTVRENEEKDGVEIIFPEKPGPEILDKLKANGWRWSRFGGLWYNRRTPENRAFAESL